MCLVHGALGIGVAAADLLDTWERLEEAALSPDESRRLRTGLRDALPA
nr:hypothetical protein [Actinomadura sp. CNU-125]